MTRWRAAVQQFISPWKEDQRVIGILVCGSYVTGDPNSQSDIDIHIVTDDEQNWRERGNRRIDGYLVEFFVNPIKQIRSYFDQDHRDALPMSIVQFVTGEIFYAVDQRIQELRELASEYVNKPYRSPTLAEQQLIMYSIWDLWDNLAAKSANNAPDFTFCYFVSLHQLFEKYCRLLAVTRTSFNQISGYLTSEKSRQRYLQQAFPDQQFAANFVRAQQQTDKNKQMESFNDLVWDVLGEFEIATFSVKTKVSLD